MTRIFSSKKNRTGSFFRNFRGIAPKVGVGDSERLLGKLYKYNLITIYLRINLIRWCSTYLGTNPCVPASVSVEVEGGCVHLPPLNIIEGSIAQSSLISESDSIINDGKIPKNAASKTHVATQQRLAWKLDLGWPIAFRSCREKSRYVKCFVEDFLVKEKFHTRVSTGSKQLNYFFLSRLYSLTHL